jgi:SAM-dependent methyltransferase
VNDVESAAYLLAGGQPADRIDTAAAHPARMYDYYLGGKDNYEADRFAAERILADFPQLREVARANRAFLHRAVRHLAASGITQFLDIGTGIPGSGDAAETARAINPATRIVAIDNDPIVAAHARARLTGQDPAATLVLEADVRNPAALLWRCGVDQVLDLGEPVALLMVSVLHFLTDADRPELVVKQLMQALAPGSYLVLSHATAQGDTAQALAAADEYRNTSTPITLRSPQRIAAFFGGLDLLDPGLVPQPWWRPDGQVTANPDANWGYGGVARKP